MGDRSPSRGRDARLAARLRRHRLDRGITQAAMAGRLGISASYLNLIEHGRRPLGAELLLRAASELGVSVDELARDESSRLAAEVLEALSDPTLEAGEVAPDDVQALAVRSPELARAVSGLYRRWREARDAVRDLAARVEDEQGRADLKAPALLPSEEVTELIHRHRNHVPELEARAEALRDRIERDRDLFGALMRHLASEHGIEVRIERVDTMGRAMRRFERDRGRLLLSELLRRGSRNFQLAHVIALLEHPDELDRLADDPGLTSDASRRLARVAMANYFAGAVLMPYERFLASAEDVRYDIELLGHRFRTTFEQVCHRLTSLRRPGRPGVSFSLLRVDLAGNLSKRFAADGTPIARFSPCCGRWNVHKAFLRPGAIRVQLERRTDGSLRFCIARTIRKESGGWRATDPVQAVGIACDAADARALVYADGIELDRAEAAVPVGTTCRLCERMDCEQRAMPPILTPMTIDENVRGVAFYAPVGDEGADAGGSVS